MVFADEYLMVPSFRRFFGTMMNDFAAGMSVILLLPDGLTSAFAWEQIRYRLRTGEYPYDEIGVETLVPRMNPLVSLAQHCDVPLVDHEGPLSIDRFVVVLSQEHFGQVWYLKGLENLPVQEYHLWIDFMLRFAQARQSNAIKENVDQTPVFCAIVPVNPRALSIPPQDVFLRVQWWWGIPSVLETRLLLREQACFFGEASLGIWCEHVLPALACGDSDVLSYLWQHADLWQAKGAVIDLLIHHLRCFAQQRGWTDTCFRESMRLSSGMLYSLQSGTVYQTTPPKAFQTMWAYGALTLTVEYGIEVHSAALAILDERHTIQHRAWRGQAHLLLPLVDTIRLSICEEITHRHGPGWPSRWIEPDSEEEKQTLDEQSCVCQWGHLVRVIQSRHLMKQMDRWRKLALLARQIRNTIAHYHLVRFQDFADVATALEEVNRTG